MSVAEMPGVERKVTKGTLVYSENQVVNELAVITEGRLVAMNMAGRMEFKKGSILGLVEGLNGKSTSTYFADEDTTMMVYPYGSVEENVKLSVAQKINPGNTIATAIRQVSLILEKAKVEEGRTKQFYTYVKEEYKRYLELCKGYKAECRTSKTIDELQEFSQTVELDDEEMEYMEELMAIPSTVRGAFFEASEYMVQKHLNDIVTAAEDVASLYEEIDQYLEQSGPALIADDSDNLFSMYEDLILQIAGRKGNVSTLLKKAEEILKYASAFEGIDKKVVEKVKNNYQEKLKMMGVDANAAAQPAPEAATAVAGTTAPSAGPVSNYTSAQMDIIRKITQNTTEKIIAYAGLDEEKNEKLRQQLTVYAGTEDKRATTDEVSKIRRSLTALYYDYYEAVITKYVKEEKPIPLLELFLNFGMLDEHLVSDVALADLFYTKRDEDMGGYQIYTMKEWLFKIYQGEHEPSRNEFDMDYDATFRDMKKTQKFTKEQEEAYKKDQKGKMIFELRNMLTSANKMTQGQIMTFCPILCVEEGESVKNMLIQKSVVKKTFDTLLQIDYSCFYREVAFWDSEHGVTNKEYIQKEIKPVILLMPNVGTKGAMWQELSGPRKDTPARFALPIMCRENLTKLAVTMLGQYRWEICRNVQGVYWNDLSEKSLTSEYFDYAQFFKKNRDLSQQAKDKIKQNLVKAKNSFRGLFVQDYTEWILLESKGSQRLNKVCREILCEYIPFPKKIRDVLRQHPSYGLYIEKFERHNAERVKKATNIETTLIKHKGKVTEDLQNYLDYLQM